MSSSTNNPLDLLDILPDQAGQQARQLEEARRLYFGTQYTAEQQAAIAQTVQRFSQRAGQARTQELVRARDSQFESNVRNRQQMDQNPRTVRLTVQQQDRAGGRKARRRRQRALASQTRPSQQQPPPATAANRFPSGPARVSEEQMAEANMEGVRNWHAENAADGTYAAYEPKKIEWDQYCQLVYGPVAMRDNDVQRLTDLPPQIYANLFTVSPHKCYNFIFYVAHRKKRTTLPRVQNNVYFGPTELAEYRFVMDRYGGAQSNPPDPSDCCGFSQVNVYKATVFNIHREQKARGMNTFDWDDCNTDALKLLMKKVRQRAPRIAKRNAEEKFDATMAPFFYLQYLPHLERYFFSKGVSSYRHTIFSSLRNAFSFKFSLAGVLRGESLERADLSDLCDYWWKGKPDPYHIHILIMQIVQGKTNQDRKLFGRAMRHREVEICPISALALYLWYRLDVDGEWADERPDFLDNHSWFFIKLLVSATTDERVIEMDLKSFADGMQDAMDAVGVNCNHRAHFGRKTMPVQLEMEEVRGELIKMLGLWAQDIQEQHYSASMPLKAMKVSMGHKLKKGSVFVKRQMKPRSAAGEQLRRLIFPWLEVEKERVARHNENCRPTDGKPTAAAFLALLDNLRDVLLQDLAVRINNPETPAHQVFRHSIFQSDDFQLYRDEMAAHMNTFQEPEHASLQRDHPGISARFDAVQYQLGNHESILNTLQGGLSVLQGGMSQLPQTLIREFATTLLNSQNTNSTGPLELQGESATGIDNAEDNSSPSPGARRLAMPPGTPAALCIDGAEMNLSPQSATEIYNQYHGIGEFSGEPIDGGFAKLEEAGNNWKATYSNAQRQRFSKLKRIVKAIDIKIASGESKDAALAFFDSLWSSTEVNRNETKMIKELQQAQLLEVKARKRKAPEETARHQRRLQHRAGSGSAPLRPGPPLLNQTPYLQALPPPINVLNPTRVI